MARTVDHISNGRLILGIGSGWFEKDCVEYGYDFGTKGGRLGALAESLPIIGDRLDKLNPLPTLRLPILIGGTGPNKSLRMVAQHATGRHALFPDHPEGLAAAISALEGWCDQFGRDPREIEWSLGLEPNDDGRVLGQYAEQYLSMVSPNSPSERTGLTTPSKVSRNGLPGGTK